MPYLAAAEPLSARQAMPYAMVGTARWILFALLLLLAASAPPLAVFYIAAWAPAPADAAQALSAGVIAAATLALVGVTWLLKGATDDVAKGTGNLVAETRALAQSTDALVTATRDFETFQREVNSQDVPNLVIDRAEVIVPTPGQGSRYVAFQVTNRGRRPATVTGVQVGARSHALQAWEDIPHKFHAPPDGIRKTPTFGTIAQDEEPPHLGPGDSATFRAQVDPIPRRHSNAELVLRIIDSAGVSRTAPVKAPVPEEWFRVVGQ